MGCTNHLIGPHRTLSDLVGLLTSSDLNGPHRSQQWWRHEGEGGAFRAIAPRRQSSPPLKIWSTHMPVPSHLMMGGRFSQIVDLFPCPLLFFYLPHPFSPPLDCLHLPSPFFPSLLSFISSGASEFRDEAYPAKTENWRDVATVR